MGSPESPRLQGILSDSCASPMCAKPSFTLVGARRSWKGFRSSAELANTSFPSHPDLAPCTQHRLPTFLSHVRFEQVFTGDCDGPPLCRTPPPPTPSSGLVQGSVPRSILGTQGPDEPHLLTYIPASAPFSTSTCRETCGRREADLQELVNKSQVPTLAACHFK